MRFSFWLGLGLLTGSGEPTTLLVGDEIIAVEFTVSATSPSDEAISTPLPAVFERRRADRPIND